MDVWGRDEETDWRDTVCRFCCPESEHDDPCCNECEGLAVRSARTKRILGCIDAIARCTKLRTQYLEETRGVVDHRVVAIDAQIAEYDRQIREARIAQEMDDRAAAQAADTQPAVTLTDAMAEEVLATMLAKGLSEVA